MKKEGSTHVFIIGSKGIPAQYGGFETFVDELVSRQKNKDIQYHVACMAKASGSRRYKDADCFEIAVPDIGPARAVYYDIAAFKYCLSYIKKNRIERPIVYVLACRIGPFLHRLKRKLKKSGGILYVNPDGHEWMRAKWNAFIRKYWKLSERLMVKHAELLVCDSRNIEKYIKREYASYQPSTAFIAYGTDCIWENGMSKDTEDRLTEWYKRFGLEAYGYYLIVGRFVPENNYETMLQEFLRSKTTKKLVIVTNVEQNKFYQKLLERTQFEQDERIEFVGTVYDSELLSAIRRYAFGYFHGHEVGGTNPSLLEALGATELNLLLDVGFNREVADDGALYWKKEPDSLLKLMERVERFTKEEREELSARARERMQREYGWEHIVDLYENIFIHQ